MEKQHQPGPEAKGFITFNGLKKQTKAEPVPKTKDKTPNPKLENQEDESLDTSFIQKLMLEEERFKETLVKMNDKAVQDIQEGDCEGGLQMLERLKKVLEYAAENGKSLDRNMIIVCLYNTACAYQMGWVLEKCAEYIDAVAFNLNQSIKQDDAFLASSKELNHQQRHTVMGIKIRKQKFLLKVYLQHCAVLSQLSKHEEALALAHKAQRVMISVLSHCANYCKETGENIEKGLQGQINYDAISNRVLQNTSTTTSYGLDFYKNFENGNTFYDEVPYLKNILEYAIPFLNNFIATIKKFTGNNIEETLKQTRKLLFNWKSNPENTEKYLRKEFTKDSFLIENENESKNRSILGLQTTPDWLKNLNIGSFMHMKPLRYKDYAEKKELVSELTKESLQEKVIMQSLIYFSTATEIRFIGMEEASKTNKEIQQSDNLRISEAYHLTAIELVCKYISGICPYVNHLIASYQKHFNQNLETIPEESFYSLNGETPLSSIEPREKSAFLLPENIPNGGQKEAPRGERKKLKITDNSQQQQQQQQQQAGAEADLNFIRRGSENIANFLKKEKTDLMQRVKSAEKQKEVEVKKPKVERSKGDIMKKFDVRSKKVLKDFNEEAKMLYENSLSSTSLTFGSVISRAMTADSSASAKSRTFNSSKNESLITSKNESLLQESALGAGNSHNVNQGNGATGETNTYFVKKGFDIPNLLLNKVLKSSENKTQFVSEKRDLKQTSSGFKSERSIQNIKLNETDNGPMTGMSERKLNAPDIVGNNNFYLYKNLSKFIQNLGTKNVDTRKIKPKKKIEEKFAENPYTKEIENSGYKKGLPKKGLVTVGSSQQSHHFAFGKPYNKKTTQENSLKKSVEEESLKYSSLSPRKIQKPNFEIGSTSSRNSRPEQPAERLTAKNPVVYSPKAIRQIDQLKAVAAQQPTKEKIKMSPRKS